MDLRIERCSIFNNRKLIISNGICFFTTTDRNYQKRIYEYFYNNMDKDMGIYIDNYKVNTKHLSEKMYFINIKENGFFLRNKKLKNVIDADSEIVKLLDIPDNVFEQKLKQLWHWSYLCSCAIGIEKGKQILIFPWISATECSIQSYRFNKLYEYSTKNDLIVIIPTESIEILKNNIIDDMKYSII